jgi:hypothetical protein
LDKMQVADPTGTRQLTGWTRQASGSAYGPKFGWL